MLVSLITLISLLTACSQRELLSTDQAEFNVSNEQLYQENFVITKADKSTECKDPIYIDLSSVDHPILRDAGDYVLSGKGTDTICIDAQDQMVHLFLDNIDLQSAGGPAIDIRSASKVIITTNSNTDNVIADSAYYSNTEEANSAIYSSCDLTINGDGILNVYGYYKDAIHSKDTCKVLGGTVNIKSKRSGIRGNDGLVVSPKNLNIESETYGLQTTKSGVDGKGTVEISGGEISMIAGRYAIQAASDVYIRSCKMNLNSVISNINTEGEMYIEEGILSDEPISP